MATALQEWGKRLGERLINQPREAGEVYRTYIHPGDTVVVLGPSDSVFSDPTLCYVSRLLARGGRVLVADPQSSEHPIRDNAHREEITSTVGPVAGIGDVHKHLEDLRMFRMAGIPLAVPEWLGPTSGIHAIGCLDESVDAIVDHATVFIAGFGMHMYREYAEAVLRKGFRESHRVLKPGGVLLLQTHIVSYGDGVLPYKQNLPDFLDESGFSVEERRVQDAFTIDGSRQAWETLKEQWNGKYSNKFTGKLRLLAHAYPSPDLLVCTKKG